MALGVVGLSLAACASAPSATPTPSADPRCQKAEEAAKAAAEDLQADIGALRQWTQDNPGVQLDENGNEVPAAPSNWSDADLIDGNFLGWGLEGARTLTAQAQTDREVMMRIIVNDGDCFDPTMVAKGQAFLGQ